MKTLIAKLAPGLAVAFLTVALGAAGLLHAQSTPTAATPPAAVQPAPATAAAVAQPAPLTVCGVCGAEIGAPRVVMVAPGVRLSAPPVPAYAPAAVAWEPAPAPDYFDAYGRPVVVYYVGGVPPRSAFPVGDYALPSAYPAPSACAYPQTLPISRGGHIHGRRL